MANREELICTTAYLTLQTRSRLNRCCYNTVRYYKKCTVIKEEVAYVTFLIFACAALSPDHNDDCGHFPNKVGHPQYMGTQVNHEIFNHVTCLG